MPCIPPPSPSHCTLIPGVILYLFNVNFGGKLNLSGQRRARLSQKTNGEVGMGSVQEATDSEQQSILQLGRRAPYNYKSTLLVPSSDFHIRNRYLSRMGAKVHKIWLICTEIASKYLHLCASHHYVICVHI